MTGGAGPGWYFWRPGPRGALRRLLSATSSAGSRAALEQRPLLRASRLGPAGGRPGRRRRDVLGGGAARRRRRQRRGPRRGRGRAGSAGGDGDRSGVRDQRAAAQAAAAGGARAGEREAQRCPARFPAPPGRGGKWRGGRAAAGLRAACGARGSRPEERLAGGLGSPVCRGECRRGRRVPGGVSTALPVPRGRGISGRRPGLCGSAFHSSHLPESLTSKFFFNLKSTALRSFRGQLLPSRPPSWHFWAHT